VKIKLEKLGIKYGQICLTHYLIFTAKLTSQAVPQAFSTVKIPANIELTTICDFSELKATIDVTFLRRIMTNLVNNAIQAMPNGGKLTVRLLRKDDSTFVTVEDTGVGISKEAMGKLFTPLFTTKAKGQGFGLVTVKRMIEALGGSVTVESEVNKGTKFTLRFRH
jgi:signal transduction histidine kinase